MQTATNNNRPEGGGDKGEQKMDTRMVGVVFVSLLIDLLAFTMILPLLPALLDYYGHNSQEGSLYHVMKSGVTGFRELVGAPDTPRWNSVLFGGVIGSLFSFLQFLSSPLLGSVSDVYGRRPVMILSMIGVAASYLLWAFSRDFSLFVCARIVGGISKGNVSLSTAVMTDICPPEKRGKGMAAIGIAFSCGFIIGPLIGAFFAKQARLESAVFFTAPALFALTLALLDIVFILAFFRETLPRHRRASSVSSHIQQASRLISPPALFKFSAVTGASAKDVRSMRYLGLVYFLFLFLYSGLEFTLTFLVHNRFNFDSMQQGKMFFFVGIIMIIVQGGYVRRIKPGKEIKTALMGLLVVIPSFILVGFAQSISVMCVGLALYSFSSATVVPCLTTVISSYGSSEQKGTVLGIFRSLGALARALGPVVSCTIYWSLGASLCYTLMGSLLSVPLLLLTRYSRAVKEQ